MKIGPQFYQSLLLCFSFILFIGCSSDDENPTPVAKGAYSNAIFIVNEGNFGVDNSSISAYFPEKDSVAHNVFARENQRDLGNTAQSMYIDDTLAYIVVNASNKMEVVSAGSFKSKGGIEEGLANPRYFTSLNRTGYITNWGTFDASFNQTEPPFIAVVDLASMEISDTVQTGTGPENIIISDNKICFTNNFGNTLGILDPVTLEVTELELAASPSAMVEDANGDLWVITGGDYGSNNGKLFKIDIATTTIVATIELNSNPAGKLAINREKDQIFYASGKSIYKISINETSAPASSVISNAEATGIYGFGFDSEKNEIYLGDANGFQSSGTIYRYDLDGTLISTFETGIGPTAFVFN